MTAFEQRDYRHMTTRRPCPPPSPAAGLAAQHPKLLPQDQDLQVLGAVISTGKDQQAGQQADGQPRAGSASTDRTERLLTARTRVSAPHRLIVTPVGRRHTGDRSRSERSGLTKTARPQAYRDWHGRAAQSEREPGTAEPPGSGAVVGAGRGVARRDDLDVAVAATCPHRNRRPRHLGAVRPPARAGQLGRWRRRLPDPAAGRPGRLAVWRFAGSPRRRHRRHRPQHDRRPTRPWPAPHPRRWHHGAASRPDPPGAAGHLAVAGQRLRRARSAHGVCRGVHPPGQRRRWLPGDRPPHLVPFQLPDLVRGTPRAVHAGPVAWGHAVLVSGAWVYVYGNLQRDGWTNLTYLARFRLGHSGGYWQFWNGRRFAPELLTAAPLQGPGGKALVAKLASVIPTPYPAPAGAGGGFAALTIDPFATTIDLRVAPRPQGPWSARHTRYAVPEPHPYLPHARTDASGTVRLAYAVADGRPRYLTV